MLIKMMELSNLMAWQEIANEVSTIFDTHAMGESAEFIEFAKRKIKQYEAIGAFDRMSGELKGVVSYSKHNNRISWFAVTQTARKKGIGDKLLKTALRQLDSTRPVSVITADDTSRKAFQSVYIRNGFQKENQTSHNGHKRILMVRSEDRIKGQSFHFNYEKFKEEADIKKCPPCKAEFSLLENHDRIADLEFVIVDVSKKAQSSLFGKCSAISKKHYLSIEEMPLNYLMGFTEELQLIGKALKKVTGAVKINYEIHSNTLNHLHVHLFPRYLDDPFPSKAIDFSLTDPCPYESDEEYVWFVEEFKEQVSKLLMKDMKREC
jgi:diadenosine tetraphosphate (Ap4A) HIT family hydrolase/GNAT superfamily N-acetyltransferase